MANPIGFMSEWQKKDAAETRVEQRHGTPVKSLVRVQFPEANMALFYFNDAFDLQVGDLVFVEGKYEGVRGRVVEVCRSFKIRAADYKKVVSVAEAEVHGQFHFAGSHFLTFDMNALPYEKVRSWFKPKTEEEFIVGTDDHGFHVCCVNGLNVSEKIYERGENYYLENRVAYVSVNGTQGRAFVEGTKNYEVEFTMKDGIIRNMLCDCPCGGHCKHEVAVLLQLKETLNFIRDEFPEKEDCSFAAVSRNVFFSVALGGAGTKSLEL